MPYPWFPAVADRVPCGEQGRAKVDRYTVTEADANLKNLRATVHGSHDHAEPGEYTRLILDGQIMMSDTCDEQRTNLEVRTRARKVMTYRETGRILISGLGLGMLLPPLLNMGMHVTVVEECQDVIDLVSPHYFKEAAWAERLTIVHADAFTWKPPRGSKWDLIYHDIWFTICEANLDELTKLKRHYAMRLSRPNGHQWGWRESTLRYQRRKSQQQYSMSSWR